VLEQSWDVLDAMGLPASPLGLKGKCHKNEGEHCEFCIRELTKDERAPMSLKRFTNPKNLRGLGRPLLKRFFEQFVDAALARKS
jgi:hypothetical protein